jgi:small-conductance mechanosensitive channel
MAESGESDVIDEGLVIQFDLNAWIPDALLPYWEVLHETPLLGAATLAVVFYLIALLTRVTLIAGLSRLADKSRSNLDNVLIDNLKRPIFTTTFLLGLILAIRVAQVSFGGTVLIQIFASIIIVSWMLTGLRLSTELLGRLVENPRFTLVEPRTIPLFDLVTKLGLLLFSSYGLLMVWGINPVGWLASAGIVGIAVGFAAKDTLANLFSGLFILADSPYQIGDYINLDTGERGEITAIGMRSTRLLTRSDVEITVPNAVIANAKITNESGGPTQKMRIRLPVGAAYGSDADEVCKVLQQVGDAHSETCSDPAPRVRMRGFGASSLDFELLCWIEEPKDRGRISHECFMAIYKAFDAAGIEIPFSKHDLYIKEYPPN